MAKKEEFKYLITFKDGSTKEETMTISQHEKLKNRKDWSQIKSVRGLGKVEEEGEGGGAAGGPGEGAATLDNVVGNGPGYYYLGQDAKKRDLTPEEEKMLNIATDKDGEVKVMSYDDFRAKSVKESFVDKEIINEAVKTQFGDFSQEAVNEIAKLPMINGLVEISGINKALSGKYKESQIRKVINAISNK